MSTETFGQTAARRLVADARAGSAGATEYPGIVPSKGYLVGHPESHIVLNLDFENIESVTASWIDTVLASDRHDFVSVGIWLNPEGKYDLDFSTHHTSIDEAHRAARIRGELAIWDIAESVAIDV